jgi:hypothetical protein
MCTDSSAARCSWVQRTKTSDSSQNISPTVMRLKQRDDPSLLVESQMRNVNEATTKDFGF